MFNSYPRCLEWSAHSHRAKNVKYLLVFWLQAHLSSYYHKLQNTRKPVLVSVILHLAATLHKSTGGKLEFIYYCVSDVPDHKHLLKYLRLMLVSGLHSTYTNIQRKGLGNWMFNQLLPLCHSKYTASLGLLDLASTPKEEMKAVIQEGLHFAYRDKGREPQLHICKWFLGVCALCVLSHSFVSNSLQPHRL